MAGSAVAPQVTHRRRALPGAKTLPQIRKQAAAAMASLPVNRIRPNAFLAAARRESSKSAALVRKGEFYAAAQAKERELFNYESFRLALVAEKALKKLIDYAKFLRRKDIMAHST